MLDHYDAAVIGGGPGGYVCAAALAKAGRKTVLIEKNSLGGTCLNRGCIPTKTLLHAAEILEGAKKAGKAGVRIDGAGVDYAALRLRKQEVVDALTGGVAQMLKAAGVDLVSGTAFVPEAGLVTVTNAAGEKETLTADDIVAAVGSVPARPPIPGLDLPGVMTSDEILAEVPELKRLVIIGGGVIGMEFASCYAGFGTQVTVLEGMPRILPPMDRELSQSLSMLMKKRGVTIAANAMVSAVEKSEGGLLCRYSVKGKECTAEGEAVLVAVGRKPLASAVFAETLPIRYERGRAVVSDTMESSVPHLYVIGDAAAGYPQLAHAASAQGLAAAAAITGTDCGTDLALVPSCVYTSPEIASVGMTEAEAKEKGIAYHTGKYPMTANGKSYITDEERGFIKLIAGGDGKMLGVQMMCARATDLIGEAALAIAEGITETQFAETVRPHPTYEEAYGEAARVLLNHK